MELATKGQYDFPRIVKRGLICAVVQVGTAVQDTSAEQYFWSQTIEALQNKCKQLISNSNFALRYHEEEIKVQIIDILEYFIGKSRLLPSMILYKIEFFHHIINITSLSKQA